MSHVAQIIPLYFQRLLLTIGSSVQHGCDMDADDERSDDARIVGEIVKQLMGGDGLRSRPFSFVPFNATATDLEQVAGAEVRRAIARLRSPVSQPSAADARRVSQALAPFGYDPRYAELASWFLTLASQRQEPPPRADPDKWRCASEAFDLVNTLSRTLPSGDREGTFIIVTEHLFEVLTGKFPGDEGAEVYRACRAILSMRRKFGLGTADEFGSGTASEI